MAQLEWLMLFLCSDRSRSSIQTKLSQKSCVPTYRRVRREETTSGMLILEIMNWQKKCLFFHIS